MLRRTAREPLPTCYRKHENIKKRAYEQRVWEVKHGSFTPLVMSLTGGLGNATKVCYKRLALMLASKINGTSPIAAPWPGLDAAYLIHYYALLSNAADRGARSARGRVSKQLIQPIDLVSTETNISSILWVSI